MQKRVRSLGQARHSTIGLSLPLISFGEDESNHEFRVNKMSIQNKVEGLRPNLH